MKKEQINEVRKFNRFYAVVLGVLDNRLLETKISLIEGRILFEINETKENCIASDIVKRLNIDKSYLSRVLKKLEKNGLIKRQIFTNDNRKFQLCMTDEGRQLLKEINELTDKNVQAIFGNISEKEIEDVINNMISIQKKLEK
ncbi:hypothetical protein IGI69_000705 [Enterococcus sp. DIV1083b]|uniref:MarR family winged helix-turn-helix transcriptional regulator n=1 Tax=Enterococcus TaxID=1350 RepID=UPI003D6B1D1E